MATFDQLPAEQRAIIELVVARGRTYDALADVLQVSTQRVRELAREALVELSPVSGRRVDPQWRGEVADYLLGQQSGTQYTATREHLERSEAARAWALSLLDALDTLFAGGDLPEVPEARAGGDEEEQPRPEPTAAVVVEPERDEEEDERERERERKRRDRDEEVAIERREREADEAREREKARAGADAAEVRERGRGDGGDEDAAEARDGGRDAEV